MASLELLPLLMLTLQVQTVTSLSFVTIAMVAVHFKVTYVVHKLW